VPRLDSPRYTILFAAAVSVACATLVAVAAVSLRDRQEANALAYRQKNVLLAAGLATPEESLGDAEVRRRFDERISVRLLDVSAGRLLPEDQADARAFDARKARNDPQRSRAAPPNEARLARLPHWQPVYLVKPTPGPGTGQVLGTGVGQVRNSHLSQVPVPYLAPVFEQVVLPVEGMGMWGMMYGFLAIDRDGNTVRGLTFYEQKETPGLGGEISNPRWQALWVGRKAYDAQWEPRLTVVKGRAGPPEKDAHRVDGLSGATITSQGVSHLVHFWLSREGYAPYLANLREGAKP
jgi:Na+-transporting NADH:ubiquinone oxidoreductase subunit C